MRRVVSEAEFGKNFQAYINAAFERSEEFVIPREGKRIVVSLEDDSDEEWSEDELDEHGHVIVTEAMAAAIERGEAQIAAGKYTRISGKEGLRKFLDSL